MNFLRLSTLAACFCFLSLCWVLPSVATDTLSLREQIVQLSSAAERTTGSDGCKTAADFIKEQFTALGLEPGSYQFPIPVRTVKGATLQVGEKTIQLDSLRYNAITPEATNGPLTGPLFYVGSGNWSDMQGMQIKDAIVVIDADSGQNWQQLASLGAQAIIYLNSSSRSSKYLFIEKEELTPIQLPCFWMEKTDIKKVFNNFPFDTPGLIGTTANLTAEVYWEEIVSETIYGLIPGSDPQ